MTKRRRRRSRPVVTLSVIALLGMAATGCSSASTPVSKGVKAKSGTTTSAKKVTITWWSWVGNDPKMVALFEKKHPNIIVKWQDVGSGPTEYTKLQTVLRAGTGAPDVVQIEYLELPLFIATGKIRNIAPYVSQYKKDYPSWVWNQVSRGSKVYAMPEDIGPMAMIYQPAIFAKYKLPVPTTWAQYKQDAIKLHKLDPSEYMTLSPAAPSNGGELIGMFWQAGAPLFHLQTNGTWDIGINTPTTRKVLSYWAQIAKTGATSSVTAYTATDFHNIALGKYATYLQAAWYEGLINSYVTKTHPQHFAVTQLPQWTAGAHVAANNGGSTNAVTKQAPHPRAAAEFAAYINTSRSGVNLDETPYVSQGKGGRGLFPASLLRTKVPAFKLPVPNFASNSQQVFSKAAGEVNTAFEWSPWTTVFEADLGVEASAVLQGKISVAAALAKVQSEVETVAKQAGYTVKVMR